MSMPNYLAKIKSSGVYRYVFDKSTIPASDQETLRLVVGYSERGPFNTPVFISDANEFISTFGNTSRRMERKGIFFHRLALQALAAGPILALNIKPFKNETAKMITFNASDIRCDKDLEIKMTPDSVSLKAYDEDGAPAEGIADRYFQNPIPDYKLDSGDTNKMIYVGQGEEATHIRTLENGTPTYWTTETPVSAGKFTYTHSYYGGEYITNAGDHITIKGLQNDVKNQIMDDALISLDGANVSGDGMNAIYDTNRFWKVIDNIMDVTPITGKPKTDYMRILQTSSKEDSVTVFMRPYIPNGYDVKISDWYSQMVTDEMPAYMESLKDHYLSEFFVEIYVFRGDFRSPGLFDESGTLGSFVRQGDTSVFYPFCKVEGEGATAYVRTNGAFIDSYGQPADALDAMSNVSSSNFVGKYQGIMLPSFKDAQGNGISIDSVFNADYGVHKCLMTLNEQLLDDASEIDINGNGVYDPGEATPQEPIAGEWKGVSDVIHALASCVHGPEKEEGEYDPMITIPVNASIVGYYLEGYNYTTILKNESGRMLVENKIMPVLGYKGIHEALTNNVDVDYKYWVDTFQGYPGVAMKSEISSIVKDKFNALALLNFPPISDCADYVGRPGSGGGFDMSEITRRGSGITLPAEIQGASWCAFYTQIQMQDGSSKFIIPSAGLVSNLFVQKWTSRQPYFVVAGPNYGRIDYSGVLGPDYNYSRKDLDQLEPYGVNAIVYIPRKGVIINSNQTAKQTPVSALSKIHVRELITYLQDTVEDMLRGYQWELNTNTLRDAVKAKCEVYCDLIKANGGIYEYKVICDETNNTPITIDNEMLVVDIEIEPGRASGKMVQTLTVHRTGGLTSSN